MRSYICTLTRPGLLIARDTVEGATPHARAMSVRLTRRGNRRCGTAMVTIVHDHGTIRATPPVPPLAGSLPGIPVTVQQRSDSAGAQ